MGVLTTSCGMGGSPSAPDPTFTADIQRISDAIATATKYPPGEVELTSSAVRLRIAVSDSTLASAAAAIRTNEATAIVVAAEHILASHPEYGKLQAISVAILHPVIDDSARKEWHTEDVIEFRKGPDQRFVMHIT